MSARYQTEDDGGKRRSTAIDASAVPGELEAVPVQPRSLADTDEELVRRSTNKLTDPLGGVTRPFRRPQQGRVTDELESDPTRTHGVPEPLPPSPALDQSGSGWFKPSLRPESIPDLGALAGDSGIRTLDYVPTVNFAEPSPPRRKRALDLQVRPWLFSVLLGATCLAVGMVLGALLFGGKPAGSEAALPIIKCGDPPAERAITR